MKIPDCQMPGPGDAETWPAGSTPEPYDEAEREDELLQMSHAELIAIVMELEDKLARAQRFNGICRDDPIGPVQPGGAL